MSRSEAAVLMRLAESIADGSAIDWDAAEASATAEEQQVIRQLKILSNLALLHRSAPPVSPGAGAAPFVRRDSASPAIGNWAHLTLIERLGGGTFADVYRAWDRHLEREVALKLLRVDDSADDLASSRIANEGRLLARVRHPNVITVHGVDAHDNRVGLWMDLVRGKTLEHQLAAHGPFSAREAAAIGIDLCRALAAIHAAGLIHRDIKAQNVMREDGGRIVLMDLGTSREADRTGTRGVPELAGTPLYLAPEIFLGSPASARTDLYSLGVLLYHLVTGSFPVRAATFEELQKAHARGDFVRLRDARADLPTPFVRVVDRAIAPDPEKRYQSEGELEADLAAAVGDPVAPRPADATSPAGAKPRFSPRTAAVLGAAAAAAILGLAVPSIRLLLTPSNVSIGPRDRILVGEFVNRTGEPLFDGTLKDALTVELQQSPYLNAVRGTGGQPERSASAASSAAAARNQCRSLGMKALILGTLSPSNGGYRVAVEADDCASGRTIAQSDADSPSREGVLGAIGVATAALRQQLGESRSSIQRFNVPADEATTASLDALKAYSLGMETRARAGDAQAIAYFNHAIELDPKFALAEAKLASIYANLHEHDQSQLHTKKAYELGDRVTERERLYIRASYHIHVTGRIDEALGAYRLWVQLYPDDWLPHNNLAALFYEQGRFDDSLKEAGAARSLSPDQIIPYEQQALTLMALGRFGDAAESLRAAHGRGLDKPSTRALLLQIAMVEQGIAGVRRELDASSNSNKDDVVLAEAARAEAFDGLFADARSHIAQAVAKARGANYKDFAASLIAEDALDAALAGETAYARAAIDRALAIGRGSDTLWNAAMAASFAGREALAAQLAKEYLSSTPPQASVVAVYGPVLEAANALARRKPQAALDALQPALAYPRLGRLWPAYLRGLASMALKRPREAADHFESVLQHRPDAPTSVLFPIARLQLARARRDSGDLQAAQVAYDAFASGWNAAATDQPLLAMARRERSRLSR